MTRLGAANLPAEVIHMVLDEVQKSLLKDYSFYVIRRVFFDIELPQNLCCMLMLVNKHWADAIRDHSLYTSYMDEVKSETVPQVCKWLQWRQSMEREISKCVLIFKDPIAYGGFYHLFDMMLSDLVFKDVKITYPRRVVKKGMNAPWEWKEPHALPNQLKAHSLHFNEGLRLPDSNDAPLLRHLKTLAIGGTHYNFPPVVQGSTDKITSLHLNCHFYVHGVNRSIENTFHYHVISQYSQLKKLSVALFDNSNQFRLEGIEPDLDELDENDNLSAIIYLPPLPVLEVLEMRDLRVGRLSNFRNLKALRYQFVEYIVETLGIMDSPPDTIESLTVEMANYDGEEYTFKDVLDRTTCNYNRQTLDEILEENVLKCTYPLFNKMELKRFDRLKELKLHYCASSLFSTHFNEGFYDHAFPDLEVLVINLCVVTKEAAMRFLSMHPRLRVFRVMKFKSEEANVTDPVQSRWSS